MKFKFITFLSVLLAVFLLTATAAFAQELQGGTVSSGGTTDMTGSGVTLQDLKGQPIAGEATSVDRTIKIEIGGLYGGIESPVAGKGHVRGRVTSLSGTPINNAIITVYTDAGTTKLGYSDTAGYYQILNIPPVPFNYHMEARAEGYFPQRVSVAIPPDQTTVQNFELTSGDTQPSPTGTVWLSIAKNGQDIALSWVTGSDKGQVPFPGTGIDVYAMIGDGNGSFTNEYDGAKWKKVLSNGRLTGEMSDFVLLPSGTTLYHHLQAPASFNQYIKPSGNPEVYYRALLTGVDPAEKNIDTPAVSNFAAALAVGKMYLTFRAGVNIFSLPLKSQVGSSLDQVLSATNFHAGDEIYFKPAAGSENTQQAVLKANDGWYNGMKPSERSTINLDYRLGYWLNAKFFCGITLVGDVLKDNEFNVQIDPGVTVLGAAYPKAVGMDETNLKESGAADNDEVYYKPSADSENTQMAVLKSGLWKDGFKPADAAKFNVRPPFGYVYNRLSSPGFTWKHKRPIN